MDEAQAAIWKGFQRFGMYYQADMPVDDFELFEKAVAWIFEEVERDGGEVQAVPVGIVEDARRMREDG